MFDCLLSAIHFSATTLYDRPPEIFQPITLQQKHEIISTLGMKYKQFLDTSENQDTAFTHIESEGFVTLKNVRPGLLISSTSWTEDENFGILLAALQGAV